MHYTCPKERFKEKFTQWKKSFCNRFSNLDANFPAILQMELAVFSNEHPLPLVKHVEDKAVQLKKFLCVLHF